MRGRSLRTRGSGGPAQPRGMSRVSFIGGRLYGGSRHKFTFMKKVFLKMGLNLNVRAWLYAIFCVENPSCRKVSSFYGLSLSQLLSLYPTAQITFGEADSNQYLEIRLPNKTIGCQIINNRCKSAYLFEDTEENIIRKEIISPAFSLLRN